MAVLTGWPTDGAEGSVSSEARWRKMAKIWAPSGVITGLTPTLGSGVINVAAGSAWVDGHYAELTSPVSETNSANGLLVVRFTAASNLFELVYRDGVSTPTQTDATWELPIGQMTAAALTDRRTFSRNPGGALAYAQVVANQAGIGAGDNALTGLTATVTVPTGRRLHISGRCSISAAANSHAQLKIKEGSTLLQVAAYNNPPAAGMGAFVNAYITPTAGAHTYGLYGTAAISNWDMAAAATSPAFIAVEDVGTA